MNKNDYISNLNKYTYNNGITIYEYYYNLAKTIRSNKKFTLEDWEMSCPFLTSEDYMKLIYSDDPRIEEYFALAMEKVIGFNRITALVPVEDKKEELAIIDNNQLTRNDLEDVIDGKFDEVKEELNRQDITDEINNKFDRINDELNRNDIQEVIDDKMDDLNEPVLSREDITDVINQEYSKLSRLGIMLTGLSKKISSILNGFAVVREDKAKKTHVYYHDAASDELKGKKTYENDSLKIDSGYYVNYQEYIEKVIDSLLEKYPNMKEVKFINENEEEFDMNQFASLLFDILRASGSIKFGNELYTNKVDTYQDLVNLQLSDDGVYAGEKLRKGMYVRRDVLDHVMSQFKAKVYLNEEEITNGRNK